MEVEKESGELVVSKLQVPTQPSFPLQNFIHKMITCLALTLPPKYLLITCYIYYYTHIMSYLLYYCICFILLFDIIGV